MSFTDEFLVKPGDAANLAARDPGATPGLPAIDVDKDGARTAAAAVQKTNAERLFQLQYNLWAENKRALLIVLQAMDTGGKDGVIRRVFGALNPQGCRVVQFKAPTHHELDHDFLWRVHKGVPRKGEIGVFNRSHYEDVLIARVRKLVDEATWKARYEQIQSFERYLVENGVTIVKLFLHISKAEQLERLKARLEDPDKNWKISQDDFTERKRWGDYHAAYEDAITKCSSKWAPWHVVPADRKWYRDYAVSQIVREAMERMDPKIPSSTIDLKSITVE